MRQILIEMAQQIVNIPFRYHQFGFWRYFLVSGSDEQPPTPRHSKQDAPILGFWNEQGVFGRKHIQRQKDVRAFARPHALLHCSGGQLPNGIRDRARGIDNGLDVYRERFFC